MPVGLSPQNADQINNNVGILMRNFTDVRAKVHAQQGWLAAEDLKVEPYNMSAEDETLIKSALSDLDTALQAVNMTFINQLIGLPF